VSAKGLEADVVFVVDRLSFDVKPFPLALYVALTRSRGNVYIVKAPGKKSWVPPTIYKEAKRL
jgi:ATP-dependent exoDNAse (exonuclease V) beta subunit